MKHRVVLTAILLASPALLTAQSRQPAPGAGRAANSITITSSDGNSSKTTTVSVPAHASCPVAMQAKQGSGAGLVAVRKQPGKPDNSPALNKPGQHIHLILGKVPGAELSDLQQVAKATLTARGLSARNHAAPAVNSDDSSDIRRTFDVTFNTENDGTLYADLDLPGFTSVRSIRIKSLALKDGSKWALESDQACVVTPDPLMLIADR